MIRLIKHFTIEDTYLPRVFFYLNFLVDRGKPLKCFRNLINKYVFWIKFIKKIVDFCPTTNVLFIKSKFATKNK